MSPKPWLDSLMVITRRFPHCLNLRLGVSGIPRTRVLWPPRLHQSSNAGQTYGRVNRPHYGDDPRRLYHTVTPNAVTADGSCEFGTKTVYIWDGVKPNSANLPR